VIADANVLLRILDGDRGAHGRAARARVDIARAGEPIGVLAATVLEVAFVLQNSAAGYGWDRAAVTSAVQAIVDEPGFAVEHDEALRAAATTYGDRGIDLMTATWTRSRVSGGPGCCPSTQTWSGSAVANGRE